MNSEKKIQGSAHLSVAHVDVERNKHLEGFSEDDKKLIKFIASN